MKIAVTYENGMIFGHFGHTEQFKIYEVENGQIQNSMIVPTSGTGHGALATLLSALGVEVLICGGIGGCAQNALKAQGIKLFGGVQGSADRAVEAFLAATLDYNPNVKCDHHGEHHHEAGHSCGASGCGSHGCGSHGCH